MEERLDLVFEPKSILDYVTIFKRRKRAFFIPAAILFSASVVAAVQWPAVYRSSAVILVEEPDVPHDLVPTAVGSYAAERVQIIAQRVQSSSNLRYIIEKNELYAEQRSREPLSSVIDKMRDDIQLQVINAEVPDPRSGRSVSATIAFNFTFDHHRPETAQAVLEELISLYLTGNERSRRERAAETTAFLVREANRYGDLVKDLEDKLARFKESHAGSLPEDMPFNLQMIERKDRDLIQIRREIQAAEERKAYLKAQLSQLDPYERSAPSGTETLNPAARLEALRVKFISMSGIYGPDHPDVRRAAREIQALEREVGGGGNPADSAALERRRQALELQIQTALERYSPDHPDVVRLQAQLESLKTVQTTASMPDASSQSSPGNPTYIQFAAEADAVNAKLRSLGTQRAALQDKLRHYETRVAQAPQVERTYLNLKREYDRAVATYAEVNDKLVAARIGLSLEEERKNERLSLLEPPTLPVRPIKPNRLAIMVVGIVFSLGIGLGSVILFELIDQRIYGPRHLASIAGSPPLVIIGHIPNPMEVQRAWALRILISFCAFLALAVAVSLVTGVAESFGPLATKAGQQLGVLLMEVGLV